MQMKRLILFSLLGSYVITNFMQKAKSENNLEKQTFNMNLLNEYHCIYVPTMSSLLLLAWEKGF